MPKPLHIERHFTASDAVRDVVIGMSDGLTVPFAIAAGLSGAINSTRIIVTAGMAEIVAGSIAMGLGGYLAARSDVEHYAHERRKEEQEIIEKPEVEAAEVADIFQSFGLKGKEVSALVQSLRARPKDWVDFMMRFELGLEEPKPRRAIWSALTIGGAYIAGGLIPLGPYLVQSNARTALGWSVGVTLAALLVFGFGKGRFTGAKPIRSALHTLLIGGLAAGAAFWIAKMVS